MTTQMFANAQHHTDRYSWLSARKTLITSTDAPALCGIGFRTPDEVYAEKVDPAVVDRVATLRMRLGTANEAFVAAEYQSRTGLPTQHLDSLPIVRHPDDPWRSCTPDAVATTGFGRLRYVQLKTVWGFPSDDWGEPGTDEIPDHYLLQVQHELDVLLAHPDGPFEPTADVAVLIPATDELRVYKVAHNADLCSRLRGIEREFLHRVVNRHGVADWDPPLRAEVANRLRSIRPDTAVPLGPDAEGLATAYQEAKRQEKEAKAWAAEQKAGLIALLDGAETGIMPDGRRLQQKVVHRKAYTVDACQYVDVRVLAAKKGKVTSE